MEKTQRGLPRFSASGSSGHRGTLRFSVWDQTERRNVSFHHTFKQAMTEAQKRNRSEGKI